MTVERAEMPVLEQGKPAQPKTNGATPPAEKDETEQVSPQEIRALASRRGWVPKQFFKGDPSTWMPPDQYLERSENELPIIKAQLRKTEALVDDLRGQGKELKGLLKKLVESQSEQRERAVSEAVTKLKADMKQAAKEGDDKEVERLADKIDETRKLGAEAKKIAEAAPEPEPKQPHISQQDKETLESWARDNPWFKNDRRLHSYAKGVWEDMASNSDDDFNDVPLKEQLSRVRKEVRAKFPEKFPNARREPGSVEGGGSNPLGRGNGAKGYDDLPSDHRAICDELVAKKVIKNRDAYVKEYKW